MHARRFAETSRGHVQQQLHSTLLEQARATRLSREMGHRERALEAVRQAAVIMNSGELRREALTALGLPDLRFIRPRRGVVHSGATAQNRWG